MSEANKAIMHRIIDEAWNEGNLGVIDEILGDPYINHDPQMKGINSAVEVKGSINMYRSAFPDLRVEINDLIAEGDKVAMRFTITGTQGGDLQNIPATGKPINLTGISISRFEDGKLVELWRNWDTIGMLQQLGVAPTPS